MKSKLFAVLFALGAFFNSQAKSLRLQDYEGHHTVNEIALASLPADFGGFEITPG